jgi:uncharacterized protein (DUF433 family)
MSTLAVRYKSKLGTGIYSITEAATYARVQPQLMARWLFGKKGRTSIFEPQYGISERTVSFLDFVQSLAVRELRLKHVKMTRIRQAMQFAKRQYGESYPFARKNYSFLLGDKQGDDIVLCPSEEVGFVVASGHAKGSRLFPFMALYLEKLEYDEEGLASQYNIYSSPEGLTVSMNPHIRFGEPMMPSGYSVATLFNAFQVEDTYEDAANAYGVSVAEIKTAHRFYYDYLGQDIPTSHD